MLAIVRSKGSINTQWGEHFGPSFAAFVQKLQELKKVKLDHEVYMWNTKKRGAV